ncbi:8656_t:CDS:2, partial [Gigaspora margarita]
DVYLSSNCCKCLTNEETSGYLATCPANKETWKRIEEELLEILTNNDTPEDQQRMLLTKGIIKLNMRKKLEHQDLENKVINHILLVWLEE